jgi:hypothetical protein
VYILQIAHVHWPVVHISRTEQKEVESINKKGKGVYETIDEFPIQIGVHLQTMP